MVIGGGGREIIKYDKTIRVNGLDMTFSFYHVKKKVFQLLLSMDIKIWDFFLYHFQKPLFSHHGITLFTKGYEHAFKPFLITYTLKLSRPLCYKSKLDGNSKTWNF